MTYEEVVRLVSESDSIFCYDYLESDDYCDYDYKGEGDENFCHYPHLRSMGNYDSIFTDKGAIQTQLNLTAQIYLRSLYEKR